MPSIGIFYMSSPDFLLDYVSYLILPMLLYMHKLLNHICYICIREVSLIKSCLVSLFLTCFFLSRRSLPGQVFLRLWRGRKFFLKENTHLGGVIMLIASIGLIHKYFMRASLICFQHAFNVFLFSGWCQRGEVLRTKCIKHQTPPN
jgi:hypothetical protein